MAVRVVRVCEVKSGRQGPLALVVHEESDVLDMVVLIARNDIEDHAAELLLDGAHRELESPDDVEGLLVGVCASAAWVRPASMRCRSIRSPRI